MTAINMEQLQQPSAETSAFTNSGGSSSPSNRTEPPRKRTRLYDGFLPGPLDVICAKGSMAYSHSGNRWFRNYIQKQLSKYSSATSRSKKSQIVTEILHHIRMASPEGGFVRCIDGVYYEIGDIKAREKVCMKILDVMRTLLSVSFSLTWKLQKIHTHSLTCLSFLSLLFFLCTDYSSL